MSPPETLFEYFCDYLFQHHGWHFPILVGMCDRCGADGARSVAMGEPFAVQLQLCPACIEWIKVEVGRQYSGVLFAAVAWAYGVAYGRRLEAGQGPEGGARSATEP